LALGGFSAEGATLADLFGGGSITVGNSRFSNWELISLDATAAPAPLLSQISVNPITNDLTRPGLSYVANGQLTTLGINAIDLALRFRVQALTDGKSYVDQELGLTSFHFGAGTGLAYLTQELASPTGADLGATLVMADKGSNFFQLSDDASFAHHFSLSVTTSIFVTGLAATDTVDLSTFTQRFAQTGPQSPAGDFDVDGDVDGRDFLVWQRGGSPLPNSSSDLATWQANYGTIANLTATLTAVPEPSTAGMALIGTTAMLLSGARSAKRKTRPHSLRAELE